MTRLSLAALAALALAGCVVVPVRHAEQPLPPPPVVEAPPEPAPLVWYHGQHFIPEEQGGGWCYEDGAHTHHYFPERPEAYVVERGYYTYAGPTMFLYVGGHPLPGGGWCFLAGPHHHDYFPPPRAGFVWHRDHGYYYEGDYRPGRLPPPAFWPRPAGWHRVPPPARLPTVPAPVYRPPRGAPEPPPPRVVPAPLPARPLPPPPAPDRFDDRDRDRRDDGGRFDNRARDRKDDHGRFDNRDRDRKDDHDRATPATPPPPPGPAHDDRDTGRGRKIDAPAAVPGVRPSPPRGKPAVTDAAERGRGNSASDKDRKSVEHKSRKDADDRRDDTPDQSNRPARPRR